MDKLTFRGVIVNGSGGHSQLVVAGRGDLPRAPEDWPEMLFPGSLDVFVLNYPVGLEPQGLKMVTALEIDAMKRRLC